MVFFKRSVHPNSNPDQDLIVDTSDDAMLLVSACTPVQRDCHPAVIAYFNDRSIEAQLEWLDGLLPGSFAGRISESYIAPLANRNFRIFVVCGNDPKRMIKLLRCYHNLVGSKLCIAMMLRSTPSDRARVLNTGFDDVFDLRTHHVEATCRLNAHLRRLEMRARTGQLQDTDDGCDQAVDLLAKQYLSARERLVLGLLHQRLGQLTPTTEIHREIRRRYGSSHKRSLHVVISLLRKKLHSDHAIVYRSEGGYVLFVDRPAGAPVDPAIDAPIDAPINSGLAPADAAHRSLGSVAACG